MKFNFLPPFGTDIFHHLDLLLRFYIKESRIRETPNLSTNADSSTDIYFPLVAGAGADTVTVPLTVTVKLLLSYC